VFNTLAILELVTSVVHVYAHWICFIAFIIAQVDEVVVILHVYADKLTFNCQVLVLVNVFLGIFVPFVITNDFILDVVKGVQIHGVSGSDITILGTGII